MVAFGGGYFASNAVGAGRYADGAEAYQWQRGRW